MKDRVVPLVDKIKTFLCINEKTEENFEFNLEEETKKYEQEYQELLKKKEELRRTQKPINHFIYTLNFEDGSFFDLEDFQGWFNFTKLCSFIFYGPASRFILDLKSNRLVENTEIFLLPKIYRYNPYLEKTGRCEFEGIEFDVWTNGLDFEIVFDERVSNRIDLNKLSEIFGRWTSRILLDSLDLTSKLDKKFKDFVSTYLNGNIDDHILNLDFYSFRIITVPNSQKYNDYFEKSDFKKITEKIWINEGAAFKDRFYPPFKNFEVYLLGHCYEDMYFTDYDVLNSLTSHLKYWVMFETLDNFTGLINSIKNVQTRAEVKKTDLLKSLFGFKITHTKMDYLEKIKFILDQLSMFGLGERYRGFENDESDAYLIKTTAYEYFDIFSENSTKKVFVNFKEESKEELIKQYQKLIKDLKERINETILAINELENTYYRSYELGLNLKAQELTLISIFLVFLIFVIQLFL